ncbi:hypothetical protein FBY36_1415 [Arthrobacter sp. SLBN-122]|nr:hypothetical protein FBY36_1415 [Arthrobacter sp. SLBN-122]
MKRRSHFPSVPPGAARTGEHCPQTGWWNPAGEEATKASLRAAAEARFIGEGSLMPPINGLPGTWVPRWLRAAVARSKDSFDIGVYAKSEKR